MYRIVTGVTSDVSVPSTYIVNFTLWMARKSKHDAWCKICFMCYSCCHIAWYQELWHLNWSNSQIPECTCSISHNAPFRTFLFIMEHCGIWNRCILRFVKLVYWPGFKGQEACEALLQGINISLLKCNNNDSATIKHIYNKFVNFIESSDVHFDMDDPLNLTEMVPVIGLEGRYSVTQMPLLHTRLLRWLSARLQ